MGNTLEELEEEVRLCGSLHIACCLETHWFFDPGGGIKERCWSGVQPTSHKFVRCTKLQADARRAFVPRRLLEASRLKRIFDPSVTVGPSFLPTRNLVE